MSLHHVSRGGARLVYEKHGVGPAVVLVQGLGLAGRMWLRVPAGLLDRGYSVVIPDNRGTGRSDAPWPPYGMTTLADDLAAVVHDSGVGPAIVVGLSLGGMIVQHLALRHPALVRGLVLAATTCGLPHGRLPNLRLLLVLPGALRGEPDSIAQVHRLLVHPSSLERDPKLFALWDREMSASTGPRARWQGLAGQLAAAASHSTGSRLGRIRCPTEIVAGEDDRIVPADNSRILAARIPGAALTMLPRSGHAFPLEHPAVLLDAVRRVAERSG